MFCVVVGFCWLVKPRFLSCHPENGKRALGSRKMKRILWLYFWPEALLPCVDARLLLSLPVPLLGVVLRFFFSIRCFVDSRLSLGVGKKKKKGLQLLRPLRVGAILRASADHSPGGVRLLVPALERPVGWTEHSKVAMPLGSRVCCRGCC